MIDAWSIYISYILLLYHLEQFSSHQIQEPENIILIPSDIFIHPKTRTDFHFSHIQ